MSLLDYRIGLAGGDVHLLEARQSATSGFIPFTPPAKY